MKNQRVSRITFIVLCVVMLSLSVIGLLHGLLHSLLQEKYAPKPTPAIVLDKDAVATLRGYAVQQHLPFSIDLWPAGFYCVRLGNPFDNKYYRTNCEKSANEAAQDILNDLRSGKPAPFDKKNIETYEPPEEK